MSVIADHHSFRLVVRVGHLANTIVLSTVTLLTATDAVDTDQSCR